MKNKIKKVLEMLSSDFDWAKHWEKQDAETLEEEFKKCVKLASSQEGKITTTAAVTR
jgi:hypothetical protein